MAQRTHLGERCTQLCMLLLQSILNHAGHVSHDGLVKSLTQTHSSTFVNEKKKVISVPERGPAGPQQFVRVQSGDWPLTLPETYSAPALSPTAQSAGSSAPSQIERCSSTDPQSKRCRGNT